MKKTTLYLMIITLSSQILGFGREVTLSFFYGASNVSDAYLISILIPGLIIGILASGVSSAYIPLYAKLSVQDGREKSDIFTSRIINFLLIVALLIILISSFFSKELIKIFAHGFNPETITLTKQLLSTTLFSIFFIILIPILSGYLQNNKKYLIPAMVGIPFNLVIIVSITLSDKFDLSVLSLGFLLANLSSVLLLGYFIFKQKFNYSFNLELKDKYTKDLFHLSIPIAIGTSINQINILIDRTIASGISEGSITALHFANRVNVSIDSIVTVSFMAIFFPVMSKLAAQDNRKGFNESIEKYILWISLIIIPASIFLILYKTEIISGLFGRGAFDQYDVEVTSGALMYYSFGMIGVAITTILTKACYALHNTRLPLKILIISIIINVCLSIILSKYIGIDGLALGTSIAAVFSFVTLFWFMKKQYSYLFSNFSIISLIFKISLSAALAGAIGKQLPNLLGYNLTVVSFIISIIVSCFIYAVMINLLKVYDIKKTIESYKRS